MMRRRGTFAPELIRAFSSFASSAMGEYADGDKVVVFGPGEKEEGGCWT